jgi:phosphoribosylformylglycinamidine synthase II
MSDFQKQLKQYRLSESEYKLIEKSLGRAPRGVEWAVFSAMWSEHCSYKSSRLHLKKFKHSSPRVLESEGENAGVVDLGQGERVAFKMESHNHPSFIEPYQGAATGVGGILRDIFTMGARPIAIADYLCFGEPQAERMEFLQKEVVHGISGYGNCVGVPTVSGQTEYDSSYNKNILVNAMAVGLFRKNDVMALSKAKGPGNWVVYVGAKTGKDGVHGASMASESFGEDSEAKKPNVQIGDPFYEKLLIESCLEVLAQNLVVSMQDMGAAGLTSSSFEMAAKGGVGMRMHLDKVPLRDSSMTPEEILLSESQERMLLVCEPKNFEKIKKVFYRWGLEATVIGEVLPESKVQLMWHNEMLTDMDPQWVTEKAPLYERPFKAWKPHSQKASLAIQLPKISALELLRTYLSGAKAGNREWIYQQYDQRVGLRTARDARQSVAFVRLPDSGRGLAVNVGCRTALVRMDTKIGAFDAIIYPALQMAVKGASALAVTDCLNFGNPEKEPIMADFVTSVEALAEAARVFDAPVVSGNVSFYNETLGQNITSTPATGLIGIKKDVTQIPYDEFVQEQDRVFIFRAPQVEAFFWGAEVLKQAQSFSGELDLQKIRRFQTLLIQVAESGLLTSARVVGQGGLLRTLAMMARFQGFSGDERFFSSTTLESLVKEILYEVVLAVRPADAEKLKALVGAEFSLQELGVVKKGVFELGPVLKTTSEDLFNTYGETEKR